MSSRDISSLRATRSGDRPRSHAGTSDAERLILEAAERLLAHVPLHELSVAQVIREAGVSRATFYFYFSSKAAVLAALVALVMDEIDAAATPHVRPRADVSLADALRERIAASAEVWRAHRHVLRPTVENWHAIPELRELWLGVIKRITDGIASELGAEQLTGGLDERIESGRLAALLAWTTERCFYVAGLGEPGVFDDELATVDVLTCIWLAGFGAQAAR
jgi:AcrR family transcriptional regulator